MARRRSLRSAQYLLRRADEHGRGGGSSGGVAQLDLDPSRCARRGGPGRQRLPPILRANRRSYSRSLPRFSRTRTSPLRHAPPGTGTPYRTPSMTSLPVIWPSTPPTVERSGGWWPRAPQIVAESLASVPDPIRTSLRAGPPATGASVARMLARTLAPLERPATVPPWLLPGQVRNVRRVLAALDRYRGALLADPVGSGKTYVALAVAAVLQRGAPDRLPRPRHACRPVARHRGAPRRNDRGRYPRAGQSRMAA